MVRGNRMDAESNIDVTRRVALPDARRVARALRAPELGPRLVFFSGGSALKPLSRRLKRYTHNSIHLITPFDSGGSSAKLREAFGILSIGDVRNRLMALADETQAGNPEIYRLFSHRFPKDGDNEALRARLNEMVAGDHAYVADIARPLSRLVQTYLRMFAERMPADFDLRGASIGNLILTGGLLNNDGDVASVTFLFSQLVEVRGVVRPVSEADRHLCAKLDNGATIVGQHRLTGKELGPIPSKVSTLTLVGGTDVNNVSDVHSEVGRPSNSTVPMPADMHPEVGALIAQADAIVFPMGSFYTSVLATLLPRGVGAAVAARGCPKVYVPNTGVDPEQRDMSLSETVARLLEVLRADLGDPADAGPTATAFIDYVLLDTSDAPYALNLDITATEALGVCVVRLPLLKTEPGKGRIDPERLSQILVSLGG